MTDLDALDANFLDAHRLFVSLTKRGSYLERRELAICSTGLDVEHFNLGFLRPPLGDVAGAAAAVRAHFADPPFVFKVMHRGDHAEVGRALEAAGWRQPGAPTPGMTLAMPASIPAAPAALTIREARTHDELVAFRECAFRGFGFPVAAAKLFLDERMLAQPNVRLYTGSVDGVPVATAMLVVTGSVAGIYWVATLEAQRRCGYGEALTWAAVAGGAEHGCRVASLQASELGRPVYARMGFDHVLDYWTWHPPD